MKKGRMELIVVGVAPFNIKINKLNRCYKPLNHILLFFVVPQIYGFFLKIKLRKKSVFIFFQQA